MIADRIAEMRCCANAAKALGHRFILAPDDYLALADALAAADALLARAEQIALASDAPIDRWLRDLRAWRGDTGGET